jgi:hypothetical protein
MFNSIGEVIRHSAERFGQKTAVVFQGREFSFPVNVMLTPEELRPSWVDWGRLTRTTDLSSMARSA